MLTEIKEAKENTITNALKSRHQLLSFMRKTAYGQNYLDRQALEGTNRRLDSHVLLSRDHGNAGSNLHGR
jgi:hypothetical protein